MRFTTLKDLVIEHSDLNVSDTGKALDLLDLPHERDNYAAANTYISALKIIAQQRQAIDALTAALERANDFVKSEAFDYHSSRSHLLGFWECGLLTCTNAAKIIMANNEALEKARGELK